MRNCYLYLILLAAFSFCCSKQESAIEPENPLPPKSSAPNRPPGPFSVTVAAVSGDTAKINWSVSVDPDYEDVHYEVYLDNQLLTTVTKDSSYTFKGLKELTAYQVEVKAVDSEKLATSRTASFTTLKYWLRFLKKIKIGQMWGAAKMVKGNDGGYLICGKSDLYGVTNFYTMKLDSMGNTLWNKSYGRTIDDAQYMRLVNSVDGYIFSTSRTVTKINNQGTVLWSIKPQDFYQVNAVCENGAGEVYVAGTKLKQGQWAVYNKYDRSGNLIWAREYAWTGNDYFYDAIISSDGRLVTLGATGNPDSKNSVVPWITKKDEQGRDIWSQTYGTQPSGGTAIPYKLKETRDGSFMFTGLRVGLYTNPYFQVAMADKNGNLLWKYDDDKTMARPQDMIETADGSIVVCGSVIYTPYYHDFGLHKFNRDGTIAWKKDYSEPSTGFQCKSIFQTADGGYIIAATKASRDSYAAIETEIYLFKTDDKGNFN